MSIPMKNRISILLLVAMFAAADGSLAGTRSESALVIPARYRVVKLAFDVANLTGAQLISYQVVPGKPDPVLHIWRGTEWLELPLQEYMSGAFLPQPKTVTVVGSDADVPPAGVEYGGRAKLVRVGTVDVVGMVTDYDKVYQFTAVEWQWLAERNGLKLVDENSERRRYGRYGRPGSEAQPEPAPAPRPAAQIKPLPPDLSAPAPAVIAAPIVPAPAATTPPTALPSVIGPASEKKASRPAGDPKVAEPSIPTPGPATK